MASPDWRTSLLAAEVAIEIVLRKLEILLSQPVCVKCLPIQTRAKDAKEMLSMMQKRISTQDRPQRSMEWLGGFLRAISDAENFIDKFHLNMAKRPFATLVPKYKLWCDLSMLVNKIKESCHDQILEEEVARSKRKNEPASSSSSSRASVPWRGKKLARLTNFWDRQARRDFFCHEAQKQDIMKRIKNTSELIQGISILGEQGSGKTFLARWAYSQVKYMGYDTRAWVYVSASMDKREFLYEILKQVEPPARHLKDMDFDEIKSTLKQKLSKRDRYLLVLDNVQLSNDPLLFSLAMIIPQSSVGRIITTTRDSLIARLMDSSETGPIKLDNLSDEESQKMLAWKMYREPDDKRLSGKEKDILEMCDGSPLLISLIGGFLSNAREHERAALEKVGRTRTFSDILQLSCHNLPLHLKPCFLYMALFPIAFPIPTRRLVRLWLADGLLDLHSYHLETPEDVGETFILELADRNVIDVVSWREDGIPKACHMCTSLYELICPITISTGFIHINAAIGNPTGPQQQLSPQLLERNNVRWLAEHTSSVTDNAGGSFSDLYLRHVRSFLSFYLRRGILTKEISTVLGKMMAKTGYSLLRVLDLEGVYKPSLDGVLHKLVLLRYLGLRSTVLDSLPCAVADLHHLETLDIKHTNITSLPSSFWEARNLRHLHLNWFNINLDKILKACSNNFMVLTQLQTLSGLVIFKFEEDLMTGRGNSLTTLTTLKLFLQQRGQDTSGAAGKRVASWISSSLANLQSLTLGVFEKGKPTKKSEPTRWIGPIPALSLAEKHHDLLDLYLLGQLVRPKWTELLPGSLRVLTLSGSMVAADVMHHLGDLLKSLRTLRLLANSFLCKSMCFTKNGFRSLKILKFWRLPNLEEVIFEEQAMLQLQELEFRNLDEMKNVRGITECEKLENICVVTRKGARRFIDQLKVQMKETTNLYEKEEIETPESTDDDDEYNRTLKEEEIIEVPIEGTPKMPELLTTNSSEDYEDASSFIL